jgi:uroporphyrinogen decarboxylase
MKTMTTRERITRMYEHRDADRVPICDTPWASTLKRWQREGMPPDVPYYDLFGLDPVHGVEVDVSPRYEEKVIAEDADSITRTTRWGATERNWKHAASTPEYLDFTITDPDKWQQAKARMTPASDRIPWDWFRSRYPAYRENGHWIQAKFRFGFEAVHAFAVGTERTLMAMCTDPEWMTDMFNHALDMNIAHFDLLIAQGYRFDAMNWTDDIGFKHRQFFSLPMYRELLRPVHQRAVAWAHAHGMKAKYHSCGDINPFLQDLLDIGVDGLHPLEVKAGMDPLHVKKTYGDRLLLHGGIDALLWSNGDRMADYVRRVLPAMKTNGGYIFATDHTIPDSASLADFQRILALVKTLGAYK